MLNEKLEAIKRIAKRDHLTVRIMLSEDGDSWDVKLRSPYCRRHLCTAWDITLEAAIDQVLEKAERSIAPHRDKMKAAHLQAKRD